MHVAVAAAAKVQCDTRRRRRSRRVEFDRAGQIVGRGGFERAGALGQFDAADILGRDRTADMETVVIAVRHVAERHVVEREADLILIESANRESRGPFIVAERIGRLEIHARQLAEYFQRARAGRGICDVGTRHGLHLSRFAAAENNDFFCRQSVSGLRAQRREQSERSSRDRKGGKRKHTASRGRLHQSILPVVSGRRAAMMACEHAQSEWRRVIPIPLCKRKNVS